VKVLAADSASPSEITIRLEVCLSPLGIIPYDDRVNLIIFLVTLVLNIWAVLAWIWGVVP